MSLKHLDAAVRTRIKQRNIWPEATRKLISVGDECQVANNRTMSADVKLALHDFGSFFFIRGNGGNGKQQYFQNLSSVQF